jgi:hypothetical protein
MGRGGGCKIELRMKRGEGGKGVGAQMFTLTRTRTNKLKKIEYQNVNFESNIRRENHWWNDYIHMYT